MNYKLLRISICIILLLTLFVIVLCNKNDDNFNNSYNVEQIKNTFDAYYINLKRRSDKNLKTIEEINKSKILKDKIKRFEGIDGKYLDLKPYYDSKISHELLEKRRGWIGCALSHIELWKRCIENNRPMLIFEDDNVIKEDLFDTGLIKILNNLPPDFDIVYLVTDNIVEYKPYNDLFVQATSRNFILSSYIISPQGAKKILNYVTPFKPYLQIDWYINRLTSNNQINCYIYRHSIMFTYQDFNTTDIQGKNNFIKKFEKNY